MERPLNYITDAKELRVGQEVFHVYGHLLTAPCYQGKVTAPAIPYRLHREFASCNEGHADSLVFEVDGQLHFASDGNLVPGKSHNRNYWFRNRADAERAQEFFRANRTHQFD